MATAEALALAVEMVEEKGAKRGVVKVFTDSTDVLGSVRDRVGQMTPATNVRQRSLFRAYMAPIILRLADLCDQLKDLGMWVGMSWLPRNKTSMHSVMDIVSYRAWKDPEFSLSRKSEATFNLEFISHWAAGDWLRSKSDNT
ncbi:hypothetical protein OQA88_5123 [Cercophora sp. LCS_1]